jgi:hypothetical protein
MPLFAVEHMLCPKLESGIEVTGAVTAVRGAIGAPQTALRVWYLERTSAGERAAL